MPQATFCGGLRGATEKNMKIWAYEGGPDPPGPPYVGNPVNWNIFWATPDRLHLPKFFEVSGEYSLLDPRPELSGEIMK